MVGEDIMGEKRTMTLNLSEEEMNSLDQLALRNDMTKTAVIKKAIRIYLILEKRMQRGEHIFVEDELHQVKAELLLV
jgi:predicted DNA-binding protein